MGALVLVFGAAVFVGLFLWFALVVLASMLGDLVKLTAWLIALPFRFIVFIIRKVARHAR